MELRVKPLLAVLLATVLLAGCGGQDTPVEQAEEEAGVEEVAEEETTTPYQAPPRDEEDAAADEAKKKAAQQGAKAKRQGDLSRGDQERLDIGTCQGEEMLADLGPERAQRAGDEIVQEVISGEFESVQEAYAARGYTCGGRYEEAFNP